jgi:hypothetical protein
MGYGGRTTAHGSIVNIASIIITTKLSRRAKHCGGRNIASTRAGSDKEIEGMTTSSVIDGSRGAVSRWGFLEGVLSQSGNLTYLTSATRSDERRGRKEKKKQISFATDFKKPGKNALSIRWTKYSKN